MARKSQARSAERRAVLDTVSDLAAQLPTPTLIALLSLLGDAVAGSRLALTPRAIHRWAYKLRWMRRWSKLRALNDPRKVTNQQLDFRVAAEARELGGADARVSPASILRWRMAWNGIGPGGLAGGPLALLDRYKTAST